MRKPKLLRYTAALALLSGVSMPAVAVNYVVDTPLDVIAVDGLVSLREAITAANTNATSGDAAAGESSGDTIVIDASVNAVVLISPLPTITDDLAITGGTGLPFPSAISGGDMVQLISVDTGSAAEPVSLASLTLNGGRAASGAALQIAADSSVSLADSRVINNNSTGTAADQGGAIDNKGTLTVTNSQFSTNFALDGSASGGAIISSGTLSVTGGSFEFNSAARAGGAIEMNAAAAVTTLNGVTFDQNSTTGNVAGTPGNGGAIHVGSSGTTSITNCDFTGNSAGEGGALWNGGGVMTIVGGSVTGNIATGGTADTDPITGGPRGGGGIFANSSGGTVDISGGTLIDNNTTTGGTSSGGGILMKDGTILIANGITISNNSANRAGGGIEQRAGSTATLTDVTLDGNTANTTSGGGGGNGGGVHITGSGNITLTNSVVTDNEAASEGGGLWNGSGTMNIIGGTITGNDAQGGTTDFPAVAADAGQGGGGIFGESPGGTINISDGTMISSNTASGAVSSGGGIFLNVDHNLNINQGMGVFSTVVISGNTANRAGGGLELRADSDSILSNVTIDGNTANTTGGGGGGNGGGVHITGSGNITLNSSAVSNNTAAAEGGGLWNGSGVMTISGGSITGNTVLGGTADAGDNAAQGGGGIFAESPGGVVNLSGGTTITGNMALGPAMGAVSSGGGIFMNENTTLNATGITISGNTAKRAGGGIEVRAGTTTTLTNVTIDGNTAFTTGDGSTGGGGNGGGLHQTGAGSITTVSSSTVSNNTAANEGGGLWANTGSTINLHNSTVSGNMVVDATADATGGGGVFLRPASTVNSINSTIAGNSVDSIGGGVQLLDNTATFNASNTLIADNTAADASPDLAGALSGSNNLVESVAGATLSGSSNVTGMDAVLGMLANNGGTTLTVLPGTGSPAIDGGDNAVCAAAPINNVDQRGAAFVRPLDGDGSGSAMCDIGAIEVQVQPVVVLSGNGNTGAGGVINVDAGSQGVAALAFGLVNNSGEAVTVNSFSGTLSGSGNFGSDVQASLVLDANGNGSIDAGDNAVPANVVINSLGKGAGGTFTVTFTPAIVVPNGSTFNYILSVNFAADLAMATVDMKLLSGGSLALIGLAGLGALRGRRRLLVVAMVVGAASLSGCGGGNGDGTGLFGQTETFQFRLSAVNGQGNTSGTPILVGGPIDGPTLRAIER